MLKTRLNVFKHTAATSFKFDEYNLRRYDRLSWPISPDNGDFAANLKIRGGFSARWKQAIGTIFGTNLKKKLSTYYLPDARWRATT